MTACTLWPSNADMYADAEEKAGGKYFTVTFNVNGGTWRTLYDPVTRTAKSGSSIRDSNTGPLHSNVPSGATELNPPGGMEFYRWTTSQAGYGSSFTRLQ